MKRSTYARCLGLVVATLAAGAVHAQQGQDDAAPALEASCMVRISSDREILPLDAETISALAQTSSLRTAVVQAVAGDVDGPDELMIVFQPLGRQTPWALQGRVAIELRNPSAGWSQEVAENALRATCEHLQRALQNVFQAEREQITQRRQAAQASLEAARERLERLHAMRNAFFAEAGWADLNRDVIANQARNLQDQIREAEMRLMTMNARQQAIQAQIAEIGKRAEQAAASDPVIDELQKALQIRQREAERFQVLFERGEVSDSELSDAMASIPRLRAEIAERREHAIHEHGGNLLGDLNQELSRLAVDRAELEAHLASLHQQMEQMDAAKLMDLADRYEREVEINLDLAEHSVRQAAQQAAEIEQVAAQLREPSVVIFGE
jgi:hypothetical protein